VEESNVIMYSSASTSGNAPRLLAIHQVCHRTGLGRTTIYDLVSKGQHPAPIKVGRSSRWVDLEVDGWIEQLISKRGL